MRRAANIVFFLAVIACGALFYWRRGQRAERPKTDAAEFQQAENNVRGIVTRLLGTKGKQPVSHFHKRLGKILWNGCGMARNAALNGSQRTGASQPSVLSVFRNPPTSMTPVAHGNSRCPSCC